jgi:hypothetical protein
MEEASQMEDATAAENHRMTSNSYRQKKLVSLKLF